MADETASSAKTGAKALNVKETTPKTARSLTPEGHRFGAMVNQATAGMKPKRVGFYPPVLL
jgi:hypothetical protein